MHVFYEARLGGLRGTTERVVDLDDGRYVERTTAGPLSSADGFDGRHFWTADATGMVTIEDHPADIVDDLAWARLWGQIGGVFAKTKTVSTSKRSRVVRLSYRGLSGPLDVTVARATGRPAYVVDRSGIDWKFARYADYRRSRGVVFPFHEVETTRFLRIVLDVRSFEVLRDSRRETFLAPQNPSDFALSGTTSLPMVLVNDQPVVTVQIDNGPPMRMLFDSGGSYSLTGRAARRLRLHLIGRDYTGGIGANVLPERYATVREIRIGRADLRNQVVPVFDADGDDTDGVIGCEILQRFAVRFDFARKRVTLSRDASALHPKGAPIALRLNDCTPEIDGRLDHEKGAFGIDTGSAVMLDIMAPYVRRHDLLAKYHSAVYDQGKTVGGHFYGGFGLVRSVVLGGRKFTNVFAGLSTMTAGAFDDPSEIGNVGVPLLRHLNVVFDYRTRRMWLYP